MKESARTPRRFPARFALCAGLGLLLILPAVASANVTLWLYPDSDNPNQGGHVVNGDSMTLNVLNRGRGNGDNTGYGIQLAVAVNDPSLLTKITLTIGGGGGATIDAGALRSGTPTYPCSGKQIPRHGIYPADHALVDLGDIVQDQVVRIEVKVEGSAGLEVHFDALGQGIKNNGKCSDVANAMGHDVTMILGDDGEEEDGCPEVTISKEASAGAVVLGEEIDYLITVANAGDCDLTEVVVTDTVPFVGDPEDEEAEEVPAFSLVAVDPSTSDETDEELSWQMGTIAAGEETEVTVTVLFDEDLADGLSVDNTACVTAAELDEPVCATATVAVGEVAGDDGEWGPGFWCNQIGFALEERHNAQFSVDELEGWLEAIKETSDVYDEAFELASLEAAQTLLCEANAATEPGDKLQRHLVALWFSVVSELLDPDLALDELCPGSAELPEEADTTLTIGDVLLAAEAELLSDEADDQELLFLKDLVDFINNATVAGEEGCPEEEAPEEEVRSSGERFMPARFAF